MYLTLACTGATYLPPPRHVSRKDIITGLHLAMITVQGHGVGLLLSQHRGVSEIWLTLEMGVWKVIISGSAQV